MVILESKRREAEMPGNPMQAPGHHLAPERENVRREAHAKLRGRARRPPIHG
jgi:hypothetical protein